MDPSGLYIHVANIETPVKASDNYLTSSTAWLRIVNRVKGRMRPLTGREAMIAAQTAERITHRYYCDSKHITDVVGGNRLVFDGRNFAIKAVRNIDEMNVFSVIDLEETSV